MIPSLRSALVGTLALGLAVALFAAPARGAFPEGWSIVWFDITGFPYECTDFVFCRGEKCPAKMFFADDRCQYDNVEGDFELGRTRTTITCSDILWGGFDFTRGVTLDVVCSRLGRAAWRFGGGTFAPGSCGAEVTQSKIVPLDNLSVNESYSGITISGFAGNGRGTCADLFLTRSEAGRAEGDRAPTKE